jgi:hypothetical protein
VSICNVPCMCGPLARFPARTSPTLHATSRPLHRSNELAPLRPPFFGCICSSLQVPSLAIPMVHTGTIPAGTGIACCFSWSIPHSSVRSFTPADGWEWCRGYPPSSFGILTGGRGGGGGGTACLGACWIELARRTAVWFPHRFPLCQAINPGRVPARDKGKGWVAGGVGALPPAGHQRGGGGGTAPYPHIPVKKKSAAKSAGSLHPRVTG